MSRTGLFTLAMLFALYLCSCASVLPPSIPVTARRARPQTAFTESAAIREKLEEGGRHVLGKTKLVIRGKRFNMDCTGTVLAIYYYAGIDLARDFDKHDGNGVTRLYKSLQAEQLLYNTNIPVTGDIIFWDNTYDRNGDGKWNDQLTHVGMVMSAARDGSIEYIHLNYRRGIIIERMNLRDPDQYRRLEKGELRIVNSPIRMKQAGREHSEKWLASQLYKTFAMGYLF